MKNVSLLIILSSLISFSYAQDINTIVKRDTSKPLIIGFYAEPLGGATQLNNDWGVFLGLRGGMVMNRKFGFGPIAKINVALYEFKGNTLNFNDSTNLQLFLVSGGVFVEYHIKMENKVHFSIPVNIMVGGASVQQEDTFENRPFSENKKRTKKEMHEVESSAVFIVEPEFNVDFNIAKFFVPSIKVGYRAVFGSQMVNASDQDLSGVYFGVGLRFGKF